VALDPYLAIEADIPLQFRHMLGDKFDAVEMTKKKVRLSITT
jgi:hypothetical protein